MQRALICLFMVLFVTLECLSQQDLYLITAQASWHDNTTAWSTTRGGNPCGCSPGPNDNVFLEGNQVVLDDTDVEINNINLLSSAANQIVLLGDARTLTVNGKLRSYSLIIRFPRNTIMEVGSKPSTSLITQDLNLTLEFTKNGDILQSWGTDAPLPNVLINSAGTSSISSNLAITSGGSLTIASGSATVPFGEFISQNGPSDISIASGTNLTVNGSINGDGTSTSQFNAITNNGTITTGIEGYINASTWIFGINSVLNVNFNGTNQTEGWWYQSSGPTSVTSDVTSTINYSANANQSVGAENYGNLILGGSGIKTLTSSGVLNILGDLTIGAVTFNSSSNSNPIDIQGNLDNNGTWSPSQLVIFSGTSAQSISGNNVTSFDNGLRVENTTGIVSLNNIGADINGELDIDAGGTFSPSDQTVYLSGNMTVEGTLTAGVDPSGFVFDGTTSFMGTGTINFNDFTIEGSVSAPTTLNIQGDFTDNGTFSANAGTVIFDGTQSQTITGSSSTSFSNIMIPNSTGPVSVSSAIYLVGTITLGANSTFNADGNLTLVSDANETATVAAIPSTANFSGNVIYQRYIDVGTGRWVNIGFPMPTAVSNFTAAGFTTGGSLYAYDETVAGNVDLGWVQENSSLSTGVGYTLYQYSGEAPGTVSSTGALNTGNVNFSLTYTDSDPTPGDENDGWNFISNPYAATIDWGAVGWTKSNITETASVWNGSIYTILDGGSAGQLIASGQGFWVQSTGDSPALSATQAVKSGTTTALTREENYSDNYFNITVTDGENTDKTYIRFRQDATEGFDRKYDFHKQTNAIFNLSSLTTSGEDYALNTLPTDVCDRIINLSITNINEGKYEMQFNDLNSLNLGFTVNLIDNYTGHNVYLSENQIYSFNVTSDAASFGEERFDLVFESMSIDTSIDYSPAYQYSCDNSVSITASNTQFDLGYQLFKDGVAITNNVSGNGGAIDFVIDKSNLVEGANTLSMKVSSSNACTSAQIINDFISFDLVGSVGSPSATAGTFCGENSATLFADGAGAGESYRWYDAPNSSEPLLEDASGEFITPVNASSKTYYVSIVSSQGCEGDRVGVLAQQTTLASPSIARGQYNCTNGAILTAEGAMNGNFYKWYDSSTSNESIAETANGELVIENVNANTTYFVSIANAQGCESEKVVITLEDTSLGTPSNVIGDEICGSGSATLMAEGASAQEFYKWYDSSTSDQPLAQTNAGVYVTEAIDASKTYFVSIANLEGCESERVIVEAEVISVQKPTIQANGDILVASEADAYQWYRNGELIEGATSKQYEVTGSGDYQVETHNGECSALSDNLTFRVTEIDDELYKLGLNIYPNPVEDVLNVSLPSNLKTDLIFNIYDQKGVLVKSFNDFTKVSNNLSISMVDLNNGIYILNIRSKNRILVLRIHKL